MKPRKKAKASQHHPARSATPARHGPKPAARRRAAPKAKARAKARTAAKPHAVRAIKGMQQAAPALAADDMLDIMAALPWSSRAKWLSAYLSDQLSETPEADGDTLSTLVDDLGQQIAALLDALDAAEPEDYIHALTCRLSAEPAHAEAGSTWLEENAADLAALDELPGYRLLIEVADRLRGE